MVVMLVLVKVCYNKYFDAHGLADTGITTYIGPLHRRQDMTDEELIARLKNNPTDEEAELAAKRLETLVSAVNSVNKEIINNKGHVRHSAAIKLSAALKGDDHE